MPWVFKNKDLEAEFYDTLDGGRTSNRRYVSVCVGLQDTIVPSFSCPVFFDYQIQGR